MPDPKLAHLGQRSCASAREGRTYERKRSDHPSQCRHLASRGRPHMAPRRGRGEDRRQEALALAGGRQDGVVLDVLVQSRRDKRAAKRLLRKLLKRQMPPPRVMVTDKLASDSAAKAEVMPSVEHRRH